MDITKTLNYIDLSPAEVKTLLLLISEPLGLSVTQMSKKNNIPRATIYGHLDSLVSKGLVKKSITERGALFFIEDINSAIDLYNEKIKELKFARDNFKEIIKNKETFTETVPKFAVYDGPRFAENILRDVLRSKVKNTYWFWPAKEMLKFISEETMSHFMEQRIERNIKLFMLWPISKTIDLKRHPFLESKEKKEPLREVRILPKEVDQFMGYGIYGTKVAFISTKRENYGFIIDSMELSNTLKVQFDYFWKISKK